MLLTTKHMVAPPRHGTYMERGSGIFADMIAFGIGVNHLLSSFNGTYCVVTKAFPRETRKNYFIRHTIMLVQRVSSTS